MNLDGRTALVTGANRGLGRHLAEQLRDRGATVFAAARRPETVTLDGVTPLRLDITDEASIARAATATRDVSVLINNAGSSTHSSLLTGSIADIQLEMNTHFLGSLLVTRAFIPQLAQADESAVLNILSVLSWFSTPTTGAYSAAKAAEWSMTNALRQELAPSGVRVSGLHVGYMDTDMAAHVDSPKQDPSDVARQALDGIEKGVPEILADELSLTVRARLAEGVSGLYPQYA